MIQGRFLSVEKGKNFHNASFLCHFFLSFSLRKFSILNTRMSMANMEMIYCISFCFSTHFVICESYGEMAG